MKILGEAPTRVAQTLLEQGPVTVAELSEIFQLTPAAIRKHLDVLEAADLVSSHEQAPYGPTSPALHGKGRPAKYFALTQTGRERFAPASNRVALSAIDFISEKLGSAGVAEFAEGIFQDLVSGVDNVDDVVERLHTAGYCPSVKEAPHGIQISMRNCPIVEFASQNRVFCDIEAKLLGDRMGANVVQISTIASGADICTLHVATLNPRRSA